MKKNLFYLFALICSMSLFTACSDDDDAPDYSKVIDSEIAGNYKGTLAVTVEGTTMPAEPQKITIEKASPSAINLSLKNFSFMGLNIGDVELKNCALSQNGDTYTFTGTQDLKVDALSCTINAKGTIVKGQVKIDMDIDANAGGVKQKVAVVYQGTRLSGSESNEAKITAFSFDMSNEANAVVIEQPVINNDNTITFRVDEAAVKADANVLKALVPTFTISDKATSSVESGKALDLSQDVTIMLLAEDGTIAEYVVKAPSQNYYSLFNFDSWKNPEYGLGKNNTLLPTNIWASGASAGGILGGVLLENEPTGENTYAAKMTTFEYPKSANALLPKITSGSLYIGSFNMLPALPPPTGESDRLKCTSFGVKSSLVISGKPLLFRGLYKYQAGEKFLDASENIQGVVVEGKKDECAIQAVLYEAKDADGNEVTLNGHDINNSEYIVASAVLADGSEKADFTPFNITFVYKEGKEYKSDTEYKFAIVCSSSKEGDRFKGAGGSSLVIDNFEVICE